MAKKVALILGLGFLLVGVVGFMAPSLLGMHLSATHSVIHLVTGIVSIGFGVRGSMSAAKGFCIAFGLVYLLLGVAGFVFGSNVPPTVPGPPGDHIMKVLPGHFEVGMADHFVHIFLGAIYLLGGMLTKTVATSRKYESV